jgi:hypothetical protein
MLAVSIEFGNCWIYTHSRSSGIPFLSILAALAAAGLAEWRPMGFWIAFVVLVTAIHFSLGWMVLRLGKSFRQPRPT